MIPLLPPLHPGELLYSLLARIHWLASMDSPKRTLEELFGNRHVRAGAAMQIYLGALSARLPPKRKLTPEKLAIETTLFPYLTAFQTPGVRAWALVKLIEGSARALHARIGLTAGVVRLPSALRYCQLCRAGMLIQQGELYWRRDHQLPGVLVCPDHGIPLADSHVILAEIGKHEFIAADEDNCPIVPPSPVWAGNTEVIKLLKAIARASSALLNAPPLARPLVEWGEHYRTALVSRSFGKGTTRINQVALWDAYVQYYSPIFDLLPEAAPDVWLAGIARKHRKSVAPLRHILMCLLLDHLPLTERLRPFGFGPWPCRNRLADHYGQPVIKDCRTHKERGKIIGVFRCSCGYRFSQSEGPSISIRILDRGPLFDVRMRELLRTKISLRATARALGVDPKTVLRHAQRLGLAIPWKSIPNRDTALAVGPETVRARWSAAHQNAPELTRKQLRALLPAEYIWLYRHNRGWLDAHPPFPTRSPKGNKRRDWATIDAAIATELRLKAIKLRAEVPPVRVTRAALERSLGQSEWLGKRLTKLPLCTVVLNELIEPLEAFQRRRITWAVEEINRKGLPIKVWRLRRLAGLSDHCIPSVEVFLKTAEECIK